MDKNKLIIIKCTAPSSIICRNQNKARFYLEGETTRDFKDYVFSSCEAPRDCPFSERLTMPQVESRAAAHE